jgi:hypothetical protein
MKVQVYCRSHLSYAGKGGCQGWHVWGRILMHAKPCQAQAYHTAYLCLMSTLHFHAACPCCMSILHVHVELAEVLAKVNESAIGSACKLAEINGS